VHVKGCDVADGCQEREGNVAGVVYVTSALPSTTPVSLAGRPMVASASEAKKYVCRPNVQGVSFAGMLSTMWSTRPSLWAPGAHPCLSRSLGRSLSPSTMVT
jgi:hypothetical protein